jgi:hypothetical protein
MWHSFERFDQDPKILVGDNAVLMGTLTIWKEQFYQLKTVPPSRFSVLQFYPEIWTEEN